MSNYTKYCEKVTLYKTSDGKLHKDPETAKKYIDELIGTKINNIISQFLRTNGYSMSDSIKLTEELLKHKQALYHILSMENQDFREEDRF